MSDRIRTMRTRVYALLAAGAITVAVADCGGGAPNAGAPTGTSAPPSRAGQPHAATVPAAAASIPQHNGGDMDADNNGGPSDGDGNV